MPSTIPSLAFEIKADTQASAYEKLIQDLRKKLKVDSLIQQLPVLSNTPGFIDVILTVEGKSVTIRLRSENVYVLGFRNNCGDKKENWYELGVVENPKKDDPNKHSIPGSSFLGYGDVYSEIEKAAGIGDKKTDSKAKGVSRSTTRLGKDALKYAARDLATVTDKEPESREKRASALIVIIQSLSEAIRLKYVCDFIVETWKKEDQNTGMSEIPPVKAFVYENNWSVLCKELVLSNPPAKSNWTKVKHDFKLTADQEKETGVKTLDDALQIVAMITNPPST